MHPPSFGFVPTEPLLFRTYQKPDDTGDLPPIATLEEAIAKVRPAIVVLDPIQPFLGAVDMHRANEVRPLLAGLARLAEQYECAVVVVSSR